MNGSEGCSGDSGGPLFVYDKEYDMYIQVGITSYFATACGVSTDPLPGVWTNVAKYVGGIEDVTRECDRARYLPIGQLERREFLLKGK